RSTNRPSDASIYSPNLLHPITSLRATWRRVSTRWTYSRLSPSGNCEVWVRRYENQHGNILHHMLTSGGTSHYALGNTDAAHERLIRQASLLGPLTERFFRQAGIAPGQRVLDVGSGVGDVTMLAARLVGPSGKVVGVERDARSIERAKTRVAEAGVNNVIFT